jgi:hypothetical protein
MTGGKSVSAVVGSVLVAVMLAVSATIPAGAAVQMGESRKDYMTTQAAVMAEVVHHEGGALPRKLTKRIVESRFGYELPDDVRIARYTRIDRNDYRVCLTHTRGGWSTWNTRTRDIKASGRGRACRF